MIDLPESLDAQLNIIFALPPQSSTSPTSLPSLSSRTSQPLPSSSSSSSSFGVDEQKSSDNVCCFYSDPINNIADDDDDDDNRKNCHKIPTLKLNDALSKMKFSEFLAYFYDKYGVVTERPYVPMKVGQLGYPKKHLEVIDLYFLQSYRPYDHEDERQWVLFTETLTDYCSHPINIHG